MVNIFVVMQLHMQTVVGALTLVWRRDKCSMNSMIHGGSNIPDDSDIDAPGRLVFPGTVSLAILPKIDLLIRATPHHLYFYSHPVTCEIIIPDFEGGRTCWTKNKVQRSSQLKILH